LALQPAMGVPKKKTGAKKKPARVPQQVGAAAMHACRPAGRVDADSLGRCASLALLLLQLSAQEHFENAEMAFAMENFDLARTSFKRALDMEPEVGLWFCRRQLSIILRLRKRAP
jgi:hypothetical protein